MEFKLDSTYKGTRILFGETAAKKRSLINVGIELLKRRGYSEMMLPIIHKAEIFANKVGQENSNMMFTFKDRGDRDLCLAPEYTAIVQEAAKTRFKHDKDVKLFYVAECFRGEQPQAGRYRQFTQLGVEVLNPTVDYTEEHIEIATFIIKLNTSFCTVNREVTRGLDYYINGKGFEITCSALGAQKQVCGGGTYENGAGFAIGIDRLLMLA